MFALAIPDMDAPPTALLPGAYSPTSERSPSLGWAPPDDSIPPSKRAMTDLPPMSRYPAGTGMVFSGACMELPGVSNDLVPVFYVLSLGLLESGASATPIELRLCNHIAFCSDEASPEQFCKLSFVRSWTQCRKPKQKNGGRAGVCDAKIASMLARGMSVREDPRPSGGGSRCHRS